ncbi:helix-turn-helix domain-containing protein [Mesorhizobium humile]|uniref:Helix-turn-helix transcriptional regulator n=1 Tax=Mesorhizobium humile TaxID=3072313 RepID=A0ABU4YMZ4_9HYPH|nr:MULTISPECIES: helix-turn-helix transcriptional regulator [unclassified Mesorhizobium]MDX8463288.1 helix-turn-helix transcriptional regulator [Mesorhizobium sp. VK2D]MDX8488368.1 helix-turn-helix transcriptional regulator [Mesorhizobium sp. VK2B]
MAEHLRVQLGEQLRRLREHAGWSQEGFASQANIDRAAYGKLERGQGNVTLITLARIAVAHEMSLAGLLSGITLNPADIQAIPRIARGNRHAIRFGKKENGKS